MVRSARALVCAAGEQPCLSERYVRWKSGGSCVWKSDAAIDSSGCLRRALVACVSVTVQSVLARTSAHARLKSGPERPALHHYLDLCDTTRVRMAESPFGPIPAGYGEKALKAGRCDALGRDPNTIKRTVSDISWYPDGGKKLAVAFAIMQFQDWRMEKMCASNCL
eukprot:1857669-Pleurochrysis_carterae.AAC.1